MKETPKTVCEVLRSWLAIEVLTPQVTRNGWSGLASEKQGQQRNRDSPLGDDPGCWPSPMMTTCLPGRLGRRLSPSLSKTWRRRSTMGAGHAGPGLDIS